MYASHRDAAIFSFYSFVLKDLYGKKIKLKPELDKAVIAYRRIPTSPSSGRNKSNIDFSEDAFSFISNICEADAVILCLDIEGFFDNMDHSLIRNSISSFLKGTSLEANFELILEPIMHYRYVFRKDVASVYGKDAKNWANSGIFNRNIRDSKCLHKNQKGRGIPQGSPISDILANIYLYDFDNAILDKIAKYDVKFYQRYCDDIFIAAPVQRAKEIYDFVKKNLAKYNLRLSENKTEAFHVSSTDDSLEDITSQFVKGYFKKKERIQYLGFEFDRHNIIIRAKSTSKYRKRAKCIVKKQGKAKTHRPKKSMSPLAYAKLVSEKINNPKLRQQTRRMRRRFKRNIRLSEEA